MRTRHGNISSQKRLQVAQMLREMRDHTEVVAVVVLPNCTPSVEWRREEGRRLLMRGLSEHKVTLGSRHLSLTAVFDAKALVMQSFSLTEEQLEELDPYVEAEEEKEPYEDYTYTVFNLVFQLPESDEEYFTRLSQMYSGFKIGMAPMRDAEEALDLIKSIYGRLYAARHISLDHAKVVECLDDLDALYRAENDDGNGERTHEECLRHLYWTEERLIAKYLADAPVDGVTASDEAQ